MVAAPQSSRITINRILVIVTQIGKTVRLTMSPKDLSNHLKLQYIRSSLLRQSLQLLGLLGLGTIVYTATWMPVSSVSFLFQRWEIISLSRSTHPLRVYRLRGMISVFATPSIYTTNRYSSCMRGLWIPGSWRSLYPRSFIQYNSTTVMSSWCTSSAVCRMKRLQLREADSMEVIIRCLSSKSKLNTTSPTPLSLISCSVEYRRQWSPARSAPTSQWLTTLSWLWASHMNPP
jgi:hypothetical protein